MGSGKGREKKVTKRARQSSTSCSETPPVYCKSRKASVIKSGLEKCRTATAAASPSNPLLRTRFHSGQGVLQPENAAAQFGGGFFYLLGTFDFGKILLTIKTPVYAELLMEH